MQFGTLRISQKVHIMNQRVNEIRDNNIIREVIIDIKYSTSYIPEDKKISSQALIIFNKQEDVVVTELDVVDYKDKLL